MKNYHTYIIDESAEKGSLLSKKLIKIPGMEVSVFETAVEAIGNLKGKPDFIVMDYFQKYNKTFDCIPVFREFTPKAKILVLINQEKLAKREDCFSFPGDEYYFKDGTESILVVDSIMQCIQKRNRKESVWIDHVLHPDLDENPKKIYFFSANPENVREVGKAFKNKLSVFSDYFDLENQYFQAKPDVVIIDFDGTEKLFQLSLLKQIRTDSCKTLTIILSPKNEQANALKAISDGASYYLVKRKNYLKRLKEIVELA